MIVIENIKTALHCHTHYSVLDGFSTPLENLQRCREVGITTYTITEHGNQYSWVYFAQLQKYFPEINLIYGNEMYECDDINIQDKNNKYYHLIVLARNEEGRKALNELTTISNLQGFYYKPRISLKEIKKYGKNLIASSACMASKLNREQDYQKCIEYINEYKDIFYKFYLEIQPHNTEEQKKYNLKLVQLANDTKTDLIIGMDAHASTKDDLYYQKYHALTARDSETAEEIYEGCYIQSTKEVYDNLYYLDNTIIDEVIENTNNLFNDFDVVSMPFQKPKLPKFQLPDGYNDEIELLDKLCINRLKELDLYDKQEYIDRFNYEKEIIVKMDFVGYFLILWDVFNYLREVKEKVGIGRGSSAGSLLCYLLNITEIDPIKYNLYFERFLNPERVGLPDIDSDLAHREVVIQYLTGKYGQNKVCQILNFSYITPVVAIKDIGKSMNIPYKETERISKFFNYDSFEQAYENNPQLKEMKEYQKWFDIAEHITGKIRQISIHAGGVCIVNGVLSDYIGLTIGSDNERVISLDKKTVESLGIVKYDFLGLKTLKIIQEILKLANTNENIINPSNDSFIQDKESFDIICNGDTGLVFQMESSGMRDLAIDLKPKTVGELSDIIALFRPDTIPFIPVYKQNKFNTNNIKYIHEDMKPILEKTYGALVYQEQIMQIVRKFGGRTLGQADMFRKAIGKKDKDLILQETRTLEQDIIQNGYTEDVAKQVVQMLIDMGGYCFNNCLHYETRVFLEDGKSITIKDLYKMWETNKDIKILSMFEDGSIKPHKIRNVMYSGKKPCYQIVTKKGNRIKLTRNHRLLTNLGWGTIEDGKLCAGAILIEGHDIYNGDEIIGIIEPFIYPYNDTDDTFDIEMASEPHNFIANRLVSHNSHSIVYAVTALQTAYLKVHYPVEFYTACFNNTNKADLSKYLAQAKENGINIKPPSINYSQKDFSCNGNNIFFGLNTINGFPSNLTNKIITERQKNGAFKGYNDFMNRVKVSTSEFVKLVKSGAIPLKDKKSFLIKYGESIYCTPFEYKPVKSLPKLQKLKEECGIDIDIYTTKEERLREYNKYKHNIEKVKHEEKIKKNMKEYIDKYLQNEEMWEFETLNMFITNNMFEDIYKHIRTVEQIGEYENGTLVGVISEVQKKKDKHKNTYCYLTVASANGVYELVVWSNQYNKYLDLIKKNNRIAIQYEKRNGSLIVKDFKDFDKWYEYFKANVVIQC